MSRGIAAGGAAALALVAWRFAGLPLALTVVVGAALWLIHTDDGRPWALSLMARLKFRWASMRGHNRYSGDYHPPGRLADFQMAQESPFAVLRHADLYTVVVADPDRQGVAMQRLAEDPALVAVSATVQSGSLIARPLALHPNSPELARDVLVAAAAQTATLPDAWTSLTWSAQGRSTDEMFRFIEEQTVGLGRVLTGAELSELVSVAFDPLRPPVMDWGQAGPGSAHEWANRYEHGSCTSVAWLLVKGDPAPLLTADPSAPLLRTTIILRPEADGTVRASTLVTLSSATTDLESLKRAAATLRALCPHEHLSPAGHAMGSTFMAGLGVGVVPDLQGRR